MFKTSIMKDWRSTCQEVSYIEYSWFLIALRNEIEFSAQSEFNGSSWKILDQSAGKDSGLAITFKVASERFWGQLPRLMTARERKREPGSGSPCWDWFPWRQSPRARPSASVRSRTFVSRSNPPLSFIPAFAGDLRRPNTSIPSMPPGRQRVLFR